MRLYLVQHGEAVDKTVDPDRPLSGQGEKDVASVASVLARALVAPEKIMHSGKTRARQTADIFEGALGARAGAVEVSGIAPLDSVSEFADRLQGDAEATMVCGHQPFMGKLVSRLLTGDEDVQLVEYTPGSVACLERGPHGGWILIGFLRPELCQRE